MLEAFLGFRTSRQVLGLDLDPKRWRSHVSVFFDFQERAVHMQASYLSAPDVLAEIGWGKVDGIVLDPACLQCRLTVLAAGSPSREWPPGYALQPG